MTEKQQNRLIACTLFAFSVSGAAAPLMGNLMPFLRDMYGISYSRAGFLLSLPSWGNVAAIFLSGYLPAYIGRRKTVLALSCWMAAAYGLITSCIGGASVLPAVCLMMGVARGGNTNFGNTMISTLPGKKSSIGYNLLHGAFAVGAVLASVILILCTKENASGWRTMTAGITVLCLMQLTVYGKMQLPEENITKSIKAVDKSFVRSRSFWLSSTILFFYISTEYAISNWLVTYFKDSGILSAELSQLMTSLLWIVIFIGRMAGAALVGRIKRKTILIGDGIGLACCFLFVVFSQKQPAVLIGMIGVGLFMATIYTNALAMGTKSIKGNDLGVSTMILIGTVGGIVTPAVVGVVADNAGIWAGMLVVAAVTVLLLLTIVFSVITIQNTED